jgi:ABC-type uncharacterized transport system auxiliary subunit
MKLSSMRFKALFIVLAGLVCGILPGCQSALATAYWLVHGTDADAAFPGLKDKKVVVVCKPSVSIHYSNQNVSKVLCQQVSTLLQEKLGKKTKVVDQRKVNNWCDKNNWEEYTEVGKAMKADFVVGIDLEKFSIFLGQTLYQGNAQATVRVFDCKDGGKEVFKRTLPPTVYPPSAGLPTSERQEDEFRNEFIGVLAHRAARFFYGYDTFDDVAVDSQALK